jgi:hypothetical protein
VIFRHQVSFAIGHKLVEKSKVTLTLVCFILRLNFFKKFGERRQNAKIVHSNEFIFKLAHVLNVSKTDAAPTWGSFVPQKV